MARHGSETGARRTTRKERDASIFCAARAGLGIFGPRTAPRDIQTGRTRRLCRQLFTHPKISIVTWKMLEIGGEKKQGNARSHHRMGGTGCEVPAGR